MTTFFIFKKKKILFKFFNIRIFSFITFIAIIIISPFVFLYRNKKIIHLYKKNNLQNLKTTKEITEDVGDQLTQNIFINKKLSEYHNAKYIFVLQPTLLYSNPITEMDKKIVNSMTEYKKINLLKVYKEYYDYIKKKLGLEKHYNANNFIDLTNIFENSDEQNFIDSVHLGNIGQKKISNIIGSKILDAENTEKKIN